MSPTLCSESLIMKALLRVPTRQAVSLSAVLDVHVGGMASPSKVAGQILAAEEFQNIDARAAARGLDHPSRGTTAMADSGPERLANRIVISRSRMNGKEPGVGLRQTQKLRLVSQARSLNRDGERTWPN